MRLALAFVAALALSVTASPAGSGLGIAEAQAQDPAYKDKFKVSVSRTGGDINVVVEGLSVKDGGADVIWYVNTDYPMSVKLSGGAGSSFGKAELTKDDAAFEGTEVKGKAKKAKFKTSVTGADKVKVAYKLVVCSATSCSPPIRGEAVEP